MSLPDRAAGVVLVPELTELLDLLQSLPGEFIPVWPAGFAGRGAQLSSGCRNGITATCREVCVMTNTATTEVR